jgi:hypothetical protein
MTTNLNSPQLSPSEPDAQPDAQPVEQNVIEQNFVDRISLTQLSASQFIERYQTPGVPVIITDLLQPGCDSACDLNSDLNSDWHLDYLCEQLGEQLFLLRCYGRERYQQDKREWTTIGSGVQAISKSFNDYAALIRSGIAQAQDIYLAKCSLQDTPLAQTPAVQTIKTELDQLGLKPASSFNLWIGPSGHVECLHYDPMDGTLIQLHGCKQIVLFPPSQTFNLYPYPFYAHLRHGLKLRSWFSRCYPDRPDFQAFPRLRQALQCRYDLTLQPGELLYIPAGWWHEVTSIDSPDSSAQPDLGNKLSNKSTPDIVSPDIVCSVNRFWRVYPTRRALSLWGRWRAYLGSICAIPHTLIHLVLALLSPNPRQKVREILQML